MRAKKGVSDMGQTWGVIEILTLCATLFMLFVPLPLYVEHAEIVHTDAAALASVLAGDRRQRFRRLRLRLMICLTGALCACVFGAAAVYLAASLSKDQQAAGLRFVVFAIMVAGVVCVLENLLFAVLIGSASFARLRALR